MGVMKTAIIFILLLLLSAGSFLSRPSEASYVDYLKTKAAQTSDNALEQWLRGQGVEQYAKSLTYQDRFLWSQVRDSDGKLIALGLFSKWFPMGSGPGSSAASPSSSATDAAAADSSTPARPTPPAGIPHR